MVFTQSDFKRLSADQLQFYNESISHLWPFDFDNQQQFVDIIIKRKNITGTNICELGFGDGVVLALLAKSGADCHGIDLSPGRFKRAEILFKLMDVNPDYRLGNILDIDFKDGSFDTVISISNLEHIAQENINPGIFKVPKGKSKTLVSDAVRQMARITKKGGNVLIYVPNGRSLLQLIYEEHHKLPFLPILPRFLAKYYVVKLIGRDPFYQIGSFLSYKFLVSLFNKNGLKVDEVQLRPKRQTLIDKLTKPEILEAKYTKLISRVFKFSGITKYILIPLINSRFYTKYISYDLCFWLTKK